MRGRRHQPNLALAYRLFVSVWGRSWGTVPHFGCDAMRSHLESLLMKALETDAGIEWLSHNASTRQY